MQRALSAHKSSGAAIRENAANAFCSFQCDADDHHCTHRIGSMRPAFEHRVFVEHAAQPGAADYRRLPKYTGMLPKYRVSFDGFARQCNGLQSLRMRLECLNHRDFLSFFATQASVSGPRGRKFKSCRPDFVEKQAL